MKEILYIQAGSLSNYIGTHFWNTQESYFTYEEDEEPEVIHDISFREGSTSKGESTYCPRLLLFDRKANFGSLSGLNGLYNDDDESSGGGQLWNGDVVEYRQEPVSKSDYQARLDAEVDDAKESNALGDKPREAEASPSDVRYWSDYNRVFFHPRTLQRLPDVADWESAEGDWGSSKAAFERHNADASLMEELFRLFVEECDILQGIQVTNDTATFGGFTDSFLTAFRDEFPKLPCLTFSILSRAFPGPSGPDDDLGTRKVINDALCLQSLDELSTLSVPIQAPATWSTGEWLEGTSLNCNSTYHTSAILSAHIESATLPLKLNGSADDLSSMCGRLSCSDRTRFAHLSGVFPFPSPLVSAREFDARMHDFSAMPPEADQDKAAEYSRVLVTRGFSSADRRTFDRWTEARGLPAPYSVHAPAYPLPNSFPRLFASPPAHLPSPRSSRVSGLPSVRTLSSLHSAPDTARLFSAYGGLVDGCWRRRADVVTRMGLEMDDLRELRDRLWSAGDAYAGTEGGGGAGGGDDGLGEDEE
ncbi:hypothetical protein AcV7_010128 [Taiwanofungus camphoratus]|nr:hypothetical protein AcV7_010128 [Antrodia cinnamomea]